MIIGQGVFLMIVGMGIVFLFLQLLVIVMSVMSVAARKFFPENSEEAVAGGTEGIDAEAEIAAAVAAVQVYTSQ